MIIEPLFYRKEVLSLYRRIFRIARHWHELTTGDADTESQYIRNEARRLFRRYKNITQPVEIELHIFEATARIEIALDFGTPYLDVLTSEFNQLPLMSNRSHLMMSLVQSKEYHRERLKKLARLGLVQE
ncbi:LYR motif containing protein 1 [Porites harrisoni]